MKREEIEQLLAEYVSGKLSAQNRLVLETLLANDSALKQEADDMLALWQMMENTVVEENNDEQFYHMLQASKQNNSSAKIINIKSKAWLYGAAAAACIVMFFIGRLTTTPIEVIKYQTRIVRQQIAVPVQQPIAQAPPVIEPKAFVPAVSVKTEPKVEESELAHQLRSVYVSERIDAIAKLSAKKNLSKGELKLLELALNEDPNPNVRLMVINSMRSLINTNGAEQVLISGLNRQNNLIVQSLLVDVLVENKSKEAIPQMLALLDNKNTDVIVQNKIRGGIESFIN